MKLIIRDDDLNYFSPIKKIERIYKGIWDKYPVHFAVIPNIYAVQGSEIPENARPEKQYYKINENKRLVDFIKRKLKEKKIVIWQHGFTHRNYGDKFELERSDFNILYRELKQGKKILENTFKVKIDTLVAPHDRFSKQAILAAEKIGYKYICRGYSPLPREFILRKEYFINFTRLFLFWLKYKTELRYPYIMDFGRHKEIFSYRIQHINVSRALSFVKNNNGILGVTLHHITVTDELVKRLKEIVKHF